MNNKRLKEEKRFYKILNKKLNRIHWFIITKTIIQPEKQNECIQYAKMKVFKINVVNRATHHQRTVIMDWRHRMNKYKKKILIINIVMSKYTFSLHK